MLLKFIYTSMLLALVSANLFDFFQNQFNQQKQDSAVDIEQKILESKCSKYLCPGTLECVTGPKDCSCPFPSSQMRCILPNGEPLCISKPAGDFDGKYDDPNNNWKVDAKKDDIRDCGWVKRAWGA
ncbi:CIC11C00000002772 [Sungouiella intermedia]|uniref:Long chronological lifespan protein 2 n=1 Tax=Sungouiella intermedia TaxID=45354 RepID=A0A1L0BQD1_9ASCO|nr:CIC11C00000002772 [[Candida] intermedia]SGZ53451.1 CIC11C00000005975 [[Candida] intermedia]